MVDEITPPGSVGAAGTRFGAGGIAGPALGASVVSAGLRTVFYVAALVLVGGLVVAIAYARRSGGAVGEPPGGVVERAEPAD